MAPAGFRYCPGFLDRSAQQALLTDIRRVLRDAPLSTPTMPRTGKPFSVRMSNCGPLGWVSDKDGGYRYQPRHPDTGSPWPAIPDSLLSIWENVTAQPHQPEACLVNYYATAAKLGLHRDEDEQDRTLPVVSISLGDSAWFRIGGLARRDPTQRLKLESGDVVVLGGAARLAYHGIDRILPDSSTLLTEGGRINLTLRRVTAPAHGR